MNKPTEQIATEQAQQIQTLSAELISLVSLDNLNRMNTMTNATIKLTTTQLAEQLYLLHPKLTGDPFGTRRYLQYNELADKCTYMSIALFVESLKTTHNVELNQLRIALTNLANAAECFYSGATWISDSSATTSRAALKTELDRTKAILNPTN